MPESLAENLVHSGYQTPQSGVLSYLPLQLVPYAELMRLAKPVGIMNIYFPYLFGTLFAVSIAQPIVELNSLLTANLWLFIAAFVLRSAGCTWNDIIDRDLDRQVTRCRLRPMPRGAVTVRNGCIFAAAQCLVWLGVLSQICRQYISYATPLIIMVGFYPFAKRLTNYAQVVLGFTLAWGVFIGCVALGVDPLTLVTQDLATTGAGLISLQLSYVVWTIIHDTVYAHQDFQDDSKAGIKSMAVYFRHSMKLLLSGLAVVQLELLLFTGKLMKAGLNYYLGAFGGTAVLLLWMIWQVDLKSPRECAWWFEKGSLIVGGTMSAGLFGEYWSRLT